MKLVVAICGPSMRPDLCRRLGEIWADEPLAALIHLQPLRHPERIGATLTAIPALTRDLAGALRAGQGSVLTLFSAPSLSKECFGP